MADVLIRSQATKAVLVAASCTIVEENPNISRCYVRDPFELLLQCRLV